jgi:hypothetical protein
VKDLISKFIQPTRTHKAISWKTVLEDTSTYLGYSFNTSIPELEKWVQLPNNQSDSLTIKNGIPSVEDYGYNMSDFFAQVLTMFNAKMAVIDGVLNIHPVWSDFWIKNSDGKLPTNIHEKEIFRYNTDEVIRSRELVFSFDLSEEYTANEQYRIQGGGVISQGVDGVKDLLTGYEQYKVFHTVGGRKDGLTTLEKTIKKLTVLADSVINTFGGSSDLTSKITNRIGMLRVSTANHGVSKLLYLNNGFLPSNHGEKINADVIYKDYYLPSSFSKGGQKKMFEGVKLPFNLKSFIDFERNAYFIGNSGADSKINRIEWFIDEDTAVIDYEEDYIYTNKLTEELI